ncbi:Hypothetical predicted protein, partial [Pelobates cultripes]
DQRYTPSYYQHTTIYHLSGSETHTILLSTYHHLPSIRIRDTHHPTINIPPFTIYQDQRYTPSYYQHTGIYYLSGSKTHTILLSAYRHLLPIRIRDTHHPTLSIPSFIIYQDQRYTPCSHKHTAIYHLSGSETHTILLSAYRHLLPIGIRDTHHPTINIAPFTIYQDQRHTPSYYQHSTIYHLSGSEIHTMLL